MLNKQKTLHHFKLFSKMMSLRSIRPRSRSNFTVTQSRMSSIYLPLLVALNWIAIENQTRYGVGNWLSQATLITYDPDTCFIRVKHICQYLHHTLGYALRYVPIPPQTKHKLWVLGDAFFCTDRGEESARTHCLPWYHLQPEEWWQPCPMAIKQTRSDCQIHL